VIYFLWLKEKRRKEVFIVKIDKSKIYMLFGLTLLITSLLLVNISGPVSAGSWYIKSPYPDYAVSGMPDFDQKQDAWGPSPGVFTWCGPVAVANSLWWLDSEGESLNNPAPVPPPTISDSFGLVTSYNPGGWDDHFKLNVDPLVKNLAFLMDTDGQQSLDGHIGTRWLDMVAGINQYLVQQGMTNQFEVHSMEFPEFEWIEEEIEKCQDVVLFLEFWQLIDNDWYPFTEEASLEAGHYVTCAGVNSSIFELLISDPWQDAFEAGTAPGRSPVSHPYPHTSDIHNDTQYVSHDAYNVSLWMGPPPSPYGLSVWELVGYLQTMGYPPTYYTFIVAAIVTSPLPTPSVGGIWVPVDKLALLAPYIVIASIIIAATAVYFTRRKRMP
jgi:hypothetical protein